MPNGQNIIGSNKDVKGDRNNITGSNATVVGNSNNVVGSNSDVKGNDNTVTGSNADVEGHRNTVTGSYADVKGDNNKVNGDYATVKGNNNIVKGNNTEIKGNNNKYTDRNVKIRGTGNELIEGGPSSSSPVTINGMDMGSMFRIGSMSAGGNTTMTFGSGGFTITQPSGANSFSRLLTFQDSPNIVNNFGSARAPPPPAPVRDRDEPTVFPEAVEEPSFEGTEGVCFICVERKAIVASNPCGHMICVKCCLKLKTTGQKIGVKHACPQCRAAVTRFTRLFFN